MKKIFSLILVMTIVLTMSVNVFAEYKMITDDKGNGITTTTYDIKDADHTTNGNYYYYNSTENKVYELSKTAENTTGGELIDFELEQADYEFTYSHPNGKTYHYSLLDEKVVGDKKWYFIYSNDLYGNISKQTQITHNNFNLSDDDTTDLGYFLNNGFLNGTVIEEGYPAFDSVAKEYIQTNNYLVEGVSKTVTTAGYEWQKFDYTEDMRITLLSINEYAKYFKKIGISAWLASTRTGSGSNYNVPFRSPATDGGVKKLRYYAVKSGNTATIALTDGNIQIRPCFWVSEDYFKNVPLASAGTEVQKVVNSIFNKEKYTIEENADGETLSPLWTNNTSVTVTDEGRIAIPKGTAISRQLPAEVSQGTLNIEADFINVGNGGYFALVVGDATNPGNNIPLYLKLSAKELGTGDDTWKRVAYRQNGGDTTYWRLDGLGTSAPSYTEPVKVKVSIDIATGVAYTRLESKINDVDTVWYSKTQLEKPLDYIKDSISATNPIKKVSIGHANQNVYPDSQVLVDNFKVSYNASGSAIENIAQLSAFTLKIDFKDGVDFSGVTTDDIIITDNGNNGVADIFTVGNSIYATLKDPIADNNKVVTNIGYFAIINNLKYADGTEVIGNSASFEYNLSTTEPFATFINETYTKGETVQAYAVVPNASGETGTMSVLLTAYKGKKLIGVKIEEIENVTADSTTAFAEDVSLTLADDADTLKVFLWNGNLAPLAHKEVPAK